MGFLSRLLGNQASKVLTGPVKEAVSFDEKLRGILQNAGTYEIRCNVPVEELEQQYGQHIFTRGGCYCTPEPFSYVICLDGRPLLYIRLWQLYSWYNHTANRQVKQFCDQSQIKMLDFFDYMPNKTDYMTQRILPYLPNT